MPVKLSELFIDPDTEEVDAVIAENWGWLVPPSMKVIMVTTMGDVFFADSDQKIYWLGAMFGEMTQVADTPQEFQQAMKQKENLENWFLFEIVSIMHAIGKPPEHGQVLSFVHPIALGGELEPNNLKSCDPLVHLSVQGQLLDQLREVPENATISEFREVGQNKFKLIWE